MIKIHSFDTRSAICRYGEHTGRHVYSVAVGDATDGKESILDLVDSAVQSHASILQLIAGNADPRTVDLYYLLRHAHEKGILVNVITDGSGPPLLHDQGGSQFIEWPDWVLLKLWQSNTTPHRSWVMQADEFLLSAETEDEIKNVLNEFVEHVENERLEHFMGGKTVWVHSPQRPPEVQEAVQTMATPWGGELRLQF